jgi:hypothetical protein
MPSTKGRRADPSGGEETIEILRRPGPKRSRSCAIASIEAALEPNRTAKLCTAQHRPSVECDPIASGLSSLEVNESLGHGRVSTAAGANKPLGDNAIQACGSADGLAKTPHVG